MKKTEEDIRVINVSKIFNEAEPFINLMMQYRCAVREIETKLYVLNDEYSVRFARNPFESIKSRIKSPESIIEKLKRRGYELTTESIQENLTDVAGIRVICSFVDDIYMLAEKLVQQDDIILIKKKDYIRYPKTNGYRSLHLIVDIPIFLSEGKKHMKVEVQFRTIAMDFWASLDHKLRYKKDIDNQDIIVEELKSCAETINDIDCRMQQIRYMIEAQGNAKKLE
ncbi:MAG: GTP pyrophosphokinase family protein [Lachnospiraceae bacterium]|nr:GTP pyrophosphokinase family protein [Lachnospiraceae bacterium]